MCVGWNAWTFGRITDLWKMLSSIGHLSLRSLSTYNWAAVQLPSAMSVSSDVNNYCHSVHDQLVSTLSYSSKQMTSAAHITGAHDRIHLSFQIVTIVTFFPA